MMSSSHHHEFPTVPKGARIAILALISFSILAAFYGRMTGLDNSAFIPAPPELQKDIQFVDTADGGVDVIDWHTNAVLTKIEPEADHFIRVVMRSLIRIRRSHDADLSAPFILTRRADGHITLEDETINQIMYLRAFGKTNAAAFARILEAPVQKLVAK